MNSSHLSLSDIYEDTPNYCTFDINVLMIDIASDSILQIEIFWSGIEYFWFLLNVVTFESAILWWLLELKFSEIEIETKNSCDSK